MNEYVQRITLEVNGRFVPFYKYMKKDDGGATYILVTITTDGVAYSPSSGDTAVIRVKRPDGATVQEAATINNDGTILAAITKNMTAVIGVCGADISISNGGQTLSTVSFYIDVDTNRGNAGDGQGGGWGYSGGSFTGYVNAEKVICGDNRLLSALLAVLYPTTDHYVPITILTQQEYDTLDDVDLDRLYIIYSADSQPIPSAAGVSF